MSKEDPENSITSRTPRRRIWRYILGGLTLLAVGGGIYIAVEIQNNPVPEEINMGSDMTAMSAMDMSGHQAAGPVGSTSPDAIPMSSLVLGPTNAPEEDYTISAEVATRAGLPDQWTFGGKVPGVPIRVIEGDHVHVTLINNLPAPTTIHWHGIQVPNASDGVSGLTQDAVPPGGKFEYDFIAPSPGTYWYHSHHQTLDQEPKGLFGTLVVEPKGGVPADRDYVLAYHDGLDPPRTGLPRLGRVSCNWRGKRHLVQSPSTASCLSPSMQHRVKGSGFAWSMRSPEICRGRHCGSQRSEHPSRLLESMAMT